MDFNILIPSISKTLDFKVNSKEDEARLSQKLMNALAEYTHVIKSLKDLGVQHTELEERHDIATKKLKLAEDLIIDLVFDSNLSSIVKNKNKRVMTDHEISINPINRSIRYNLNKVCH